MLVRIVAKQTKASRYLCDGAFKHAAGISTDYLIIFGISAIKITVLAQYLAPMIVLAIGGIAFTLWLIFWVAPRIMGDDWFEKRHILLGLANRHSCNGHRAIAHC